MLERRRREEISFKRLRESEIVLVVAALAVVCVIVLGSAGMGAGVPNVAPGQNLFRAELCGLPRPRRGGKYAPREEYESHEFALSDGSEEV